MAKIRFSTAPWPAVRACRGTIRNTGSRLPCSSISWPTAMRTTAAGRHPISTSGCSGNTTPCPSAWLSGRRRKAVMASYNAWNGTPMTVHPDSPQHPHSSNGALRCCLDDGGAVTSLVKRHQTFPDRKDAMVASVKAGINQFLDSYKDETHAALADGSLTAGRYRLCVRRKMRIAIKLGLLDPPESRAVLQVSKTRPSPGTPTSIARFRGRLRWSRSRPSRPSLGDVHGSVSPALIHSRPISGPHVGSFPTTTIATSDLRAAATAAAPSSLSA